MDWYGTIAVVSRARRLLQNYYTTEESYSEEHQYIINFYNNFARSPFRGTHISCEEHVRIKPLLKNELAGTLCDCEIRGHSEEYAHFAPQGQHSRT